MFTPCLLPESLFYSYWASSHSFWMITSYARTIRKSDSHHPLQLQSLRQLGGSWHLTYSQQLYVCGVSGFKCTVSKMHQRLNYIHTCMKPSSVLAALGAVDKDSSVQSIKVVCVLTLLLIISGSNTIIWSGTCFRATVFLSRPHFFWIYV